MKLLNLGCSSKTSNSPDVINIDWSLALSIRKNPFLSFCTTFFLSNERKKRIRSLPKNILVYDLSKGIPFGSNSIDVVYHSHLMEHIDRENVKDFLIEVKRVLKPNGIHRIVVPDFYLLCTKYIENFKLCSEDKEVSLNHDNYIGNIIEQSVRKEASGTSKQNFFMRYIENIILGDARKRGETHQWMYDKINLSNILAEVGFSQIKQKSFLKSDIKDWNSYGLDTDDSENEYKPGSLYIESRK